MDMADGMLNHENEGLQDRVATLEKKVQQNEDEILCLKSALADALRRINNLEAGRGAGLPNNVLPSKPFKSTPRKTTPSLPHTGLDRSKRAGSVEQAFVIRDIPPSSGQPRRAPTPTPKVPQSPGPGSTSLKKWSSLSSAEFNNTSSVQLNMSGTKEVTFNQDEGYLRMYLRGRAITMYAPSDFGSYDVGQVGQAPSEKLKLEWVYGYRGRDCRSNVHLLPTGELIYFAAAVVVLYNVEEQIQRHYLGHTDDVKCVAVHPDKFTIASGQVAGHDKKAGKLRKGLNNNYEIREESDHLPHVRIWNSVSLQTLHVIGIGDFERAVCCLGFSKADGGHLLCAVDEGNEHVLSVWEWEKGEKGHKLAETKSSQEPVLAAEFHPLEKNAIVTCGKTGIMFWTLEGGTLGKKLGLYDKNEKPKYVLCIAFAANGDVLTGDSNGNIYVWGKGGNHITHSILGAHEGGIFSLLFLKDGSLLSGGGKDRRVVQWDASYQKTLEAELPVQHGPVRTLTQGKGNLVVVGTTRNAILQGTFDLNFSPIVQGHMDELWGLAVHPNQNQFLTCAYDKHVYLWDSLAHTAVWCKEINDGAHCASFHPEGHLVAIGTQTARWLVLDVTTHDIVSVHTDGNEQIECIEYSPDGSLLAVGSRDNYIYMYQVTEEGKKYSRVGRCSGHTSFITHIDWSKDNQCLQSNSGDYEILYWNASTCKQIVAASSLRDVEWATQRCTLGFNACGIWPEGADGTDVNGCCRANKLELLASADDHGKVKLFTYPAKQPKSSCHAYGGHSSHVTAVRFLHDDSRLISAGGKDMAVLQWEIL